MKKSFVVSCLFIIAIIPAVASNPLHVPIPASTTRPGVACDRPNNHKGKDCSLRTVEAGNA